MSATGVAIGRAELASMQTLVFAIDPLRRKVDGLRPGEWSGAVSSRLPVKQLCKEPLAC